MNLTGNTILITGGGSGIGRGLAEELHKRGNKVIISGRRKSHLDSVAKANPGIEAIELDIADPENIKVVAKKLIAEHPDLNVLINNAGIMEPDQAAGVIDDKLLVSTVTTNLLGPIRLTSAFVDHLKRRRGVIVYNTSVLGFVPLAVRRRSDKSEQSLASWCNVSAVLNVLRRPEAFCCRVVAFVEESVKGFENDRLVLLRCCLWHVRLLGCFAVIGRLVA
jgi:uncharacterized oxidoreductase